MTKTTSKSGIYHHNKFQALCNDEEPEEPYIINQGKVDKNSKLFHINKILHSTRKLDERLGKSHVPINKLGLSAVHEQVTPIKLDSGATDHYLAFKDLKKLGLSEDNINPTVSNKNNTVQTAGGDKYQIVGSLKVGKLNNVKLVNGITTSMASVGRICDNGYQVLFTKEGAHIGKGINKNSFKQSRRLAKRVGDGLYNLNVSWTRKNHKRKPKRKALLTDTSPKDSLALWHARLGHVDPKTIINGVEKGILTGIKLSKEEVSKMELSNTCITCALSKLTRRARKHATSAKLKVKKPYEYMFMDICGPSSPIAYDGSRYFLVLYDLYSSAIWALPIRTKDESYKAFNRWYHELRVHNHMKVTQICRIRSDQAGELFQGRMKELLHSKGIHLETTAPHSSYQNSFAERGIRTITTMARCMLHHSGAPHKYWSAAVMYAAYVNNFLPCRGNPNNLTPVQRLENSTEPVSINHIRTFYCPVFVVKKPPTLKRKRNRFNPRGDLGWFLGMHGSNSRAYIIKLEHGKQVVKPSRDVYFMENIKKGTELVKRGLIKGNIIGVNDELSQIQISSIDDKGVVTGSKTIWPGPGRKPIKEHLDSDESSDDTESLSDISNDELSSSEDEDIPELIDSSDDENDDDEESVISDDESSNEEEEGNIRRGQRNRTPVQLWMGSK